jgi:ketosteroid isomerase-like protein
MPDHDWLATLFAAIDRMDADAFTAHLTDSVEFQFGNLPVVRGSEQVSAFVSAFFGSIRSLRHELAEHWVCGGGTIICRGVVTYERHDGSTLSVPFANIIKIAGNRAFEYRIYADTSQLYLP